MSGHKRSGGGGGGYGGGSGGGSTARRIVVPRGTAPPAGARPHQSTPGLYFMDPVGGVGRQGGNVDAVEGSNRGRQNIRSSNPAGAALRRMYSGYSNSVGR